MTAAKTTVSYAQARSYWWWFILIYCLSYKEKTLGEIARRPLYFEGVFIGFALLIWLVFFSSKIYKYRWSNFIQPSILFSLLLCIIYLIFQSLLYPSSINDVLYSTTTTTLIFCIAIASIAAHGWYLAISDIFISLLAYSVINIALVGGSLISPAVYEYLPTSPLESGFGIRIAGLAGDPTHLGAFFSITLMLMFILRSKYHQWWYKPIALLIFIGLLATGTRNAVLSMLVGIGLALIASDGIGKSFKVVAFILMSSGFLLWVLYMIVPDSDVLLTAIFRLGDENSFSRFSIWRDLLDIASDLNYYEILMGGGYLFIQDVYGSPYNAFARIFFNQGLFYLIGLMAVVIQIFILAAKDNNNLRKSLIFSLLGYWISFSMFLDTLFAEFFHASEFVFWLAAAIAVTSNLTRRNATQSRINTHI